MRRALQEGWSPELQPCYNVPCCPGSFCEGCAGQWLSAKDMYAAMQDLANDEEIKAKQMEVANLQLGLV